MKDKTVQSPHYILVAAKKYFLNVKNMLKSIIAVSSSVYIHNRLLGGGQHGRLLDYKFIF